MTELVNTQLDVEPYVPFDAYRELAYQVALALNSRIWSDPEVQIELMEDSPLSLCSTQVWGGSIGLNHPKLMWNYPIDLCFSVVQGFEEVQ